MWIGFILTGYLWVYLFLRCVGKLSVSARGWHAASVYWRGRVVCPAMRLFGAFQPLLRLESEAVRRVLRWLPRRKEQPVPDVVVEFVPIT
jgi:hypothetical protein